MDKGSFLYQYNKPCFDWFETVTVEIKPDDYYYFRMERRSGPHWWIMGMNPKSEPSYHWEVEEIGEIRDYDLRRFVEWAKSRRGSKIIEVKTTSGDIDIIGEILKFSS